MGFFIYSNTLEIHVINLRGQDSLKTQTFVQKNREITIMIYWLMLGRRFQTRSLLFHCTGMITHSPYRSDAPVRPVSIKCKHLQLPYFLVLQPRQLILCKERKVKSRIKPIRTESRNISFNVSFKSFDFSQG